MIRPELNKRLLPTGHEDGTVELLTVPIAFREELLEALDSHRANADLLTFVAREDPNPATHQKFLNL